MLPCQATAQLQCRQASLESKLSLLSTHKRTHTTHQGSAGPTPDVNMFAMAAWQAQSVWPSTHPSKDSSCCLPLQVTPPNTQDRYHTACCRDPKAGMLENCLDRQREHCSCMPAVLEKATDTQQINIQLSGGHRQLLTAAAIQAAQHHQSAATQPSAAAVTNHTLNTTTTHSPKYKPVAAAALLHL